MLFSSRFYEGCKRCLNEGGVFVAQNGVAFMQIEEVQTTRRRLSPYFSDQNFYCAAVPTYVGGNMTLAWGSDNEGLRDVDLKTIEARFKESGIQTRYYNPRMHVSAFALPQYIVDALDSM